MSGSDPSSPTAAQRRALVDAYLAAPTVEGVLALLRLEIATLQRPELHPYAPMVSVSVRGMTCDPLRQSVMLPSGNLVLLTPQDTRVLHLLMSESGNLMTTGLLGRRLWADESDHTGAVQQSITRIRRAIESDPREPRYVVTVPGAGYTFLPFDVDDETEETKEESEP